MDVVVKDGRIAGEGAEGAGPDDPRTQVDVEEQAVRLCPWIKRVCRVPAVQARGPFGLEVVEEVIFKVLIAAAIWDAD